MTGWIVAALLAGLVMFAVTLYVAWRWRQLERWIVRKIRHHERNAQATEAPYAHQWHRAQVKALDEVLVVMSELERGRNLGAYRLAPRRRVAAQWVR